MEGKKVTAVFIDDDPIVNFVHKNLLNRYFPEIEFVSFLWAREALDYFRGYTPAPHHQVIVFLDINMPEMDGWELIDEFVAQQLDIPVYLLTSSIDFKDRNKAENNTYIKGFYLKPFKIEIFERVFGVVT